MTMLEFAKRTAVVVGIALVPVLIWYLFGVILIVLGAVLIAILLRLLTAPFVRWGRLPDAVALILSGMVVLGIMGGAGYLFGTLLQAELADVLQRAGAALASISKNAQGSPAGRLMLDHLGGSGVSVASLLGGLFRISTSVIVAVIVAVVAGFYLAAQPKVYRRGLAKMFPPDCRATANAVIDDLGQGLQLWLLGQLLEMLLIGAMSAGAVWLIGLPSPLALGVIAGVAEFLPYLGPLVAAIPALLVATTQGSGALWETALAYLLIHQIEGNLIAPLIQRHMVFIPPAVMLLGIVTVLFLFGTSAAIFAAPLVVIVYILVWRLYLYDGRAEALPAAEPPKPRPITQR
jgi:predicted PurR-regulated permease PerM